MFKAPSPPVIEAINRISGSQDWTTFMAYLEGERATLLDHLTHESDEGAIRNLQGAIKTLKAITSITTECRAAHQRMTASKPRQLNF
jgi:hypothetical protein